MRLGNTIDAAAPRLHRLGIAMAFAAIGLSAGWTAGHLNTPAKRDRPPAGNEIVSSADRVRTDVWKTFGSKGAIVMVGDSHTEYADWQAMFPGVAIVNRGIGGDTTGAVLARLDTILSVSAATAVVTLGTNDILHGDAVAGIEANYHAILDRLIESGSRVIVTSTPLTTSRRTNARIAALNADVRAYCNGASCTFLDLNAAIGSNGVLSRGMTIDGIHLNGAGYALWAVALAPYLRN